MFRQNIFLSSQSLPNLKVAFTSKTLWNFGVNTWEKKMCILSLCFYLLQRIKYLGFKFSAEKLIIFKANYIYLHLSNRKILKTYDMAGSL